MRRFQGRSLAARLLAALALATAAAPAAALDVFLRSPRPEAGVFGQVTVEADVLGSEPVAELVVRVDGRVVARLTKPPWRTVVDVGQDNVGHRFEVVVHGAGGETARAEVETRPLRVDEDLDLELRQLYVTVTRDGRRVTGLPRHAFVVRDEGVPQEIVTFEGGDAPLTAVLLVDTSTSMRGERLRAALAGVRSFAGRMRGLDQASLVLFSDRLLHATPFTSDPARLVAGLEGVEGEGGTALNDALYTALARLDAVQGRRVVLVLSDGADVESVLGIRSLGWKLRRSQTALYWLRLLEDSPAAVVSRTSAWRTSAERDRQLRDLAELVAESGGRVLPVASAQEIPRAFEEVLAELRDQYVLGFYPTWNADDGRWHPVAVEVVGRGYVARTREGYVDEKKPEAPRAEPAPADGEAGDAGPDVRPGSAPGGR